MLTYLETSIFDSPAKTLVNPINCGLVMGAGLAFEFRKRYPAMFEAFLSARRNTTFSQFKPGNWWPWINPERAGHDVLCVATKDHWRDPSRIEYIRTALRTFRIVSALDAQLSDGVAFPQLGCGLGGLDWAEVQPLMDQYLTGLQIPVYIHVHKGKR